MSAERASSELVAPVMRCCGGTSRVRKEQERKKGNELSGQNVLPSAVFMQADRIPAALSCNHGPPCGQTCPLRVHRMSIAHVGMHSSINAAWLVSTEARLPALSFGDGANQGSGPEGGPSRRPPICNGVRPSSLSLAIRYWLDICAVNTISIEYCKQRNLQITRYDAKEVRCLYLAVVRCRLYMTSIRCLEQETHTNPPAMTA